MEFIKKHSNKFLVSIGAAALLVGGFYIIKNNQAKIIKPNGEEINITHNPSVVFLKDDKYHAAIAKLKPIAAQEIAAGGLSKQTIVQINQVVIHVFKDDYIRILVEGRHIRRKFINNIDLYVKEFMKHANDAEKLMENASIEVLKDLNVSLDEYERSSERILEMDPSFAMFNLYMFEAIKMQIPSERNRALTKDQLIQILSFQAQEYATTAFDNFNLSPQQVIMLKQTYVSDKASINFAYEEEDIMKNPGLLQDPEIGEVQKKLQEVMLADEGGNFEM